MKLNIANKTEEQPAVKEEKPKDIPKEEKVEEIKEDKKQKKSKS